jgi:hypothetical protein
MGDTAEFLSRVQALEAQLADKQRESNLLIESVRESQSKLEALSAKRGWRERYLNGWFGGDRKLLLAYNSEKQLCAQFNQSAEKAIEVVKDIDKKVTETIDDHLRSTNASYLMIATIHKDIAEVKSAGDILERQINNALDALSSAISTEWVDLATNNNGISFLSYLENDSAREAVAEVEKALNDFRDKAKALKEQTEKIKEIDLKSLDLDNMDLVFDLAFDDVFDFMSIFVLDELEKAKENIDVLAEKIKPIQKTIGEEHCKFSKNVADLLTQKLQQLKTQP